MRGVILISRVQNIYDEDNFKAEKIVDYAHVGYFVLIAILECISAVFLLRRLASTHEELLRAVLKVSLLRHLMRSTEIRVASLALIGISRAITYTFNPSLLNTPVTTPRQIDRFVYTLECVFPVMI